MQVTASRMLDRRSFSWEPEIRQHGAGATLMQRAINSLGRGFNAFVRYGQRRYDR
jgi:hypothetical protein